MRVYNPELTTESVYNLTIEKPKKYAYFVNLDKGKYTLKVKKLTKNMKEAVVVIDAGHGGSQKGAIGCLGDKEKDINLKIALQVEEFLKNKGIKVIMTRDYDADISLQDRINIAKENFADVFVSIHNNSIDNVPLNIHRNRGTSVYYCNNNSKKLADLIQNKVTKTAGTRNNGVHTASFTVIRPTEYTGVLVETAYMTNPFDTFLYKDDKWINKAAKGIAEGIISYLKQ